MTGYKDILGDTLGKLADKVKEAADSSGVLDVYAQGASRAKAFGQIAKLSLEINSDHEELKRIYTEIGRLYFEQAKGAPEGVFVPLFEQAERANSRICEKRGKIDALRDSYGIAPEEGGAEIIDFDKVVSATEADGTTVDHKPKE